MGTPIAGSENNAITRLDVIDRNTGIDRFQKPLQLGGGLRTLAPQMQQDRRIARAHLEQRKIGVEPKLMIRHQASTLIDVVTNGCCASSCSVKSRPLSTAISIFRSIPGDTRCS